MPDVFELTIEPRRRAASTFSSSARLMSSCSTTASMIQSLSLTRGELVEAAGRDQLPRIGREERIRLQRARALEPVARGIGRDIEQQRRNAGVGEVRGDLRAHRAGAQDGHATDHHLSILGRDMAPHRAARSGRACRALRVVTRSSDPKC